jgi:hypothetical protein
MKLTLDVDSAAGGASRPPITAARSEGEDMFMSPSFFLLIFPDPPLPVERCIWKRLMDAENEERECSYVSSLFAIHRASTRATKSATSTAREGSHAFDGQHIGG